MTCFTEWDVALLCGVGPVPFGPGLYRWHSARGSGGGGSGGSGGSSGPAPPTAALLALCRARAARNPSCRFSRGSLLFLFTFFLQNDDTILL